MEAQDSAKVDQAIEQLTAGNHASAQALLLSVVANAPAEYAKCSENPDGGLSIRFWDQQEFIHYVLYQKQQGIDRGVSWIPNAYPRAYYYLGFLCVKTRQFERALEYLDCGQALEPTNPHFIFEKAQALIHCGKKQEALALYESIHEVGPHVSVRDLAVALRGCGFVLIEMGRLKEAEEAFKSSLEMEPGNSIATNELQYIVQLRQGGRVAPCESVPTAAASLSTCAVCGNTFTEGVLVSVKGMPYSLCKKCERKHTKKWWQFWK